MKHILAALDLTAHADCAFERASMLAAAHGAKLTLVHIVDSNVLRYEDEGGTLAEAMKAKAELRLAGYTDRLDPESQSAVDSHVIIGKAWEEIIAVADRVESDLIVIGLHHVKPIKDAFRGTTAERDRACAPGGAAGSRRCDPPHEGRASAPDGRRDFRLGSRARRCV